VGKREDWWLKKIAERKKILSLANVEIPFQKLAEKPELTL
jgi:hypothetical protein